MSKEKIFLDTVHGYISVPEEYCKLLIDTEFFQRLRRIEQTSMRALFPCAHHDRFIHSLGTFYIGSKITKAIEKSSEIRDFDYPLLKETFQIACLLHDIGHCPFSHTTEKYYDQDGKLNKKLLSIYNSNDFIDDYNTSASEPKPHERISAIIVKSFFKNNIKEINPNIDLELICRMICGIKYETNINKEKKFKNCMIELLNGLPIDADKIDYILRDKWASGYGNYNIDIDRLINSINIFHHENEYKVVFHKNSLSEIKSVIDSRNGQYVWVFDHHKIKLEQYLLTTAIEKSIRKVFTNAEKLTEQSISDFFDIETFFTPKKIGHDKVFRITEDDIMVFLKRYMDEIPEAKAWLSRKYPFKPLWKSYPEFKTIFKKLKKSVLKENGSFYKKAPKKIENILQKHNLSVNDYYFKTINTEYKTIDENEIFILIGGDIVCFTTLGIADIKKEDLNNDFAYLYLSEKAYEYKNEILCALKTIQ